MSFLPKSDANQALDAVEAQRSLTQPGFAIGDALREKAQDGLPLFSRSAMKDNEANIRRGTAAMNEALLNKTTVHRAMFRNGLGWVDFEWGDVGLVKPSGKTKGAMGLAHILEARQRKDGMTEQQAQHLLHEIVVTIAKGTETNRLDYDHASTVTLQLGKVEALLVKHAGSNAWVLTGWKGDPGVASAGFVAPDATHSAPTTARSEMGAGSDSSIDQSGEDGGPLFSRSPKQLSAQVGALVKGLTVTNIRNKGVDWRGIGLQMLGRRQLKELYGNLFPQGSKPDMMASYNTLAMKMDAEKNEAGAAADALATRWGKLPKKVGDALAELMHDATRLQIDPRKPRQLGDIKKHYDELRAEYDDVTKNAEAKSIFDAAAAAYEAHYAAVKLAVHERVDRAMVGNPNKAAMLANMDAQFFGKIKGIYFPLARFGDYLVQVNWRGASPNPVQGPDARATHVAKTMAEGRQLRMELLERYSPWKGFQVASIIRHADYNAVRHAVGRATSRNSC